MSSRNRHAHRTAWTNYHACKIQPLKIVVKNTNLMMWALRNSLTRRYLPSNSQNNSLYAAAATKKKDSTAKPFRASLTFNRISDDVSWQVKIGLHQSDYLSQVKIKVKTVNNSHTQDIWRVLRLSAGQCRHRLRETISFLVSNLSKCWLVLKFF